VVERGDDDEQSMREAFAALRRYVVRLSSDFGARLAMRLLALAAARDKADPALMSVFAGFMSEAVSIVVAPLSGGDATAPTLESGADDSSAPSGHTVAPKTKEDDDERS
jgi:hypothetical protein